jgi:hypothetical protein
MADLHHRALEGAAPQRRSGRQEQTENVVARIIDTAR